MKNVDETLIEARNRAEMRQFDLMASTHEQIMEIFGHPKRAITNPQTNQYPFTRADLGKPTGEQ